MHLTIYCDGGSRGNPGYGYGSYEICREMESVPMFAAKELPLGDHLTNNQAEYLILIAALEKAAQIKPESVLVWADSKLMVEQVNCVWKCKSQHLKPLRDQVISMLTAMNGEINWNSREVSVEKFGH